MKIEDVSSEKGFGLGRRLKRDSEAEGYLIKSEGD
jgi:hypothetical protein